MAMNKRNGISPENLIALFFLLLLGLLLVLVFFMVIKNMNNKLTNYYHDQTRLLCNLSNEYRQIIILKNPDMQTQFGQALDCNKIVDLTLT